MGCSEVGPARPGRGAGVLVGNAVCCTSGWPSNAKVLTALGLSRQWLKRVHCYLSGRNDRGWATVKPGASPKSPTQVQRPKHRGQPLRLFQATSSELDQGSWDLKWHLQGMPVLAPTGCNLEDFVIGCV